MLNHRKTPGRSGRRSVRGGAIFAALALAFSATAFFGTGPASAQVERVDAACSSNPDLPSCFTVTTTINSGGDSFPLGTTVQDTATVVKTELCPVSTSDLACAGDVSPDAPVAPPASVTYQLFDGENCDGTLIDTDTVTTTYPSIPGQPYVAPSSDGQTLPAGGYSYLATFNTQQSENVFLFADAECEPFTIDPVTPSVSTTIHPSNNVNEGTTVFDSATVSGVNGFTPTGTVSFTFYNGWNCGSTQSFLGSFVLDSNGFTQSVSVGAPSAGEYSFLARYNGDSNFNASTGVCENLSVNGVTPPPVVPPAVVQPPVVIVQPVPQPVAPQPAQIAPAAAVRATGTFTG